MFAMAKPWPGNPIGDRKDGVCLQLYGQVSRQPKSCRSAMLDPKTRAFCLYSNARAFLETILSEFKKDCLGSRGRSKNDMKYARYLIANSATLFSYYVLSN